jgi:pyrophosphatase PpaX
MIKAVIFDLDGVLVNTFDSGLRIFQKSFARAGYHRPSKSDMNSIYHLSLHDTVKTLTGSDSESEIRRVMEMVESFEEIGIRPPKNLVLTLRKLRRSYGLAVVSSSGRDRVRRILKTIRALGFFDVIVGIEDHTRPKPHPEPLLIAAKRLGVKPSEAVYLGDRETDIEAAEAAGMRSIGYLEFVRHRLPAADLTTKRFDRIPYLVKKLSE